MYVWALMSTTQLKNNTLCYCNDVLCEDSQTVFVCLAGWWVRQWPSKWVPTFRTSARQMWPKWLVGVPRFSNVLPILTHHHHWWLVGAPEAQDEHWSKIRHYVFLLSHAWWQVFLFFWVQLWETSCGKPAGFSHLCLKSIGEMELQSHQQYFCFQFIIVFTKYSAKLCQP